MLRWLVLALLFVPGAQACSRAAVDLDLAFERPEGCARATPGPCDALPQADAPYTVDGLLTWSWETDACSTTVPSATPVHIHLKGLEREQTGWLAVTLEPSEVTLEPTDQWDLADDDIDPAAGRIRGREQVAVRATVALVGEPSELALERMASRNGLVPVDVRADADQTQTFPGTIAIGSILLDGQDQLEPAGEGRDAPLPSALLALAALAVAVLVRRR